MSLPVCFLEETPKNKEINVIHLVAKDHLDEWLKSQPRPVQNWVEANDFKASQGNFLFIPNKEGKSQDILAIIGKDKNLYALAKLSKSLSGVFELKHAALDDGEIFQLCLGWALGQYDFNTYKTNQNKKDPAQLIIPEGFNAKKIMAFAQGTFLTRDLINTPPNDMQPQDLEEASKKLAEEHGAELRIVLDDQLVEQDYHAIYAVGRGSDNRPRMIDMTWGRKTDPKITLVGKGVCFDTGGLSLKPTSGMVLMKKDMGGAAHVLGLAHMIMAMNLRIRLRVIIGAVENSISGDAYRPSDIIQSKKGLTIEITNTDAEGRLVLADCLAEACTEDPDLLIDFATLTGAARVALGPDIPPIYSNDDILLADLVANANEQQDPMWPLPLWDEYNSYLDSLCADMVNSASGGFAGSITAGLFLQRFVEEKTPWVHIDCYGWTKQNRPGRPTGGEAQGIRAVFSYLEKKYGS